MYAKGIYGSSIKRSTKGCLSIPQILNYEVQEHRRNEQRGSKAAPYICVQSLKIKSLAYIINWPNGYSTNTYKKHWIIISINSTCG